MEATEGREPDALEGCACALDNLLALWVMDHGYDWNAVDAALDALAGARRVIPTLPITAAYADKVRARTTEEGVRTLDGESICAYIDNGSLVVDEDGATMDYEAWARVMEIVAQHMVRAEATERPAQGEPEK